MHFTIFFLALFFLPAFAQPFIPKIGEFVSVIIGDPASPSRLAVIVGYHGAKIMGAFVYPPSFRGLHNPGRVSLSRFYTSSHLGDDYTVSLSGRVINMNHATERKDLEPMSLDSVKKLRAAIKSE